MAAIAQGDADAFTRLVEQHIDWALRFVERMLGNRALAEDLVQSAFLNIWERAAGWEPRARFSTWFYRVLYNRCLDQFRARGRHTDVELDEEIPDASAGAELQLQEAQTRGAVRDALAALPERQRAALVLCYYEELSQPEAAALLGVSVGALESLLSRARSSLKRTMQTLLN